MSGTSPVKKSNKTPKRLRHPMKRDGLSASSFLKYNLPWACDDCSHFDPVKEFCTIGFDAHQTRREKQQKEYILSGQMTVCRYQEID